MQVTADENVIAITKHIIARDKQPINPAVVRGRTYAGIGDHITHRTWLLRHKEGGGCDIGHHQVGWQALDHQRRTGANIVRAVEFEGYPGVIGDCDHVIGAAR